MKQYANKKAPLKCGAWLKFDKFCFVILKNVVEFFCHNFAKNGKDIGKNE